FYGSVQARGGSQSGNGGFAEISGKHSLIFRPGSINLTAKRGTSGALLLDPTDIEIVSAGSSTYASFDANVNGTVEFAESAGTALIDPASLPAVTILQATHDITFT